jgi:hypothetical protein
VIEIPKANSRYIWTTLRTTLTLVLLLAFGCGYALEGTRKPEKLKGAETVAIPIFVDETGEPGLGFLITQRVRQRFLEDGRLLVVEGGGADTILQGAVLEYRLDPIGFSATDQVQRYRALVKVAIQLRDESSGKVILKQIIQNDSEFEISASITESASSRTVANRQAAQKFSEELVSLILEGF